VERYDVEAWKRREAARRVIERLTSRVSSPQRPSFSPSRLASTHGWTPTSRISGARLCGQHPARSETSATVFTRTPTLCPSCTPHT
jgi:hypothetical protein